MTDPSYAIFRGSNRENMKLWVAALRSGNYVQTEGALRKMVVGSDTPRFCCLGVATEVAIMRGAVTGLRHALRDEGDEGGGYVAINPSDHYENGTLPEAVREWLGVASSNPSIARVTNEGGSVEATGANDTLKWDFNRIADELEYTYMLRFTDAEVIAAADGMIKRGNNTEASRILRMLLRERSSVKVALPAPPVRTEPEVKLT